MSPGLITLDELGGRVRALRPSAGNTAVVAVDGPSGSGKSTLARGLGAVLAAPVVRMDDIYPGWDGLDQAVPRLVEWVLEPLAAGRPARYRRFDWVENDYAEWHELAAAPVLLVEGVASGSRSCAGLLSGVIWVEAERDERFRRGIERDGDAYLPHWRRWALQEDEHFAREATRARADLVLDGNHSPDGEAVGNAYLVLRCGSGDRGPAVDTFEP